MKGLLIVSLMLVMAFGLAMAPVDGAETWGGKKAPVADAADGAVAADPAGARERKQKRLQRQLGVNIRNVRKVMQQLKKDGDIDMTDAEAVADAVQTELVMAQAGNPEIDWGAIDWDKLFAFILKIVQLFMSIS